MKSRILLPLFALILSGSGALAQDNAAPATTPPADPEKIAVATKVLEETHVMDNMAAVLDTMTPAILASIKQQMPTISDDTYKLIAQMLPEEMKATLPKLLTMDAQIYSEHFTLDELKALDSFYQTTAGQKIITETPKILKETVPIGMAWGRQAAADAMQRVITTLRAQGVKI